MKANTKLSLLALVAALMTTACGGGSGNNGGGSSDNFSIITDLDDTYTIHTERQKQFLEYSGEYRSMPTANYPDGDQFISDPEPMKLEWELDNDEVTKYSVVFGQEEDLGDGYEVMGTAEPSIELSNVFLGTNYFYIKAYNGTEVIDESDVYSFDIDETCPRNLKIDGLTNCRDMGGRELTSGGRIKQGMIYRTSGNNYQTKAGAQNVVGRGIISDAGKKEMLEHLQVKTEINVNDSTRYNLSLENTTVKDIFMEYGGSAHSHFSRNTESVKNFFEILADESNYPVFYHCRIGTDRTGLCGILTNGLLGVELNDIYQDYLFSNFGNIEGKRYIGEQAGQDNIENYVALIEKMDGENFQNKVYNTLLSIGVPAATLDAVIENLTEGDLAEGNQAGQIVKKASEFTANGVTAKTTEASDRSHPTSYVELTSASQSVSITFEAEKDFTGQIVSYLGNTEYVANKKVEDAIKVTLDGNPVLIISQTYQQAGFGNVNGRMNYFPVILNSSTQISKGSHTLTFTGTTNKMNVGTICVFGQR